MLRILGRSAQKGAIASILGRNLRILASVEPSMRCPALLIGLLVVALSSAQDPTAFTRPPREHKVGTVDRWALEVKFQAMGQDAVFTGNLQRKVVEVQDNGDYSVETRIEEAKVSIMRGTQDQPSEPHVSKVHKDGSPVDPEPLKNELDEVLTAFFSAELPEKGAKSGGTWKLDSQGRVKGEGDVRLVGPVDWQRRKCLQLETTYKCAEPEGTAKGSVYLDRATGRLVGIDATFTKVKVAVGIESDGSVLLKPLSQDVGTQQARKR
jgi:hypothetical protein